MLMCTTRVVVASLLLIMLPKISESLVVQFQRRDFFFKVATATVSCAGGGIGIAPANAAIDVSGLRQAETTTTPGRAPNQRGIDPSKISSGPLANTKLGFQVGGGPRPEEVVKAIDEPRYAAVRKAQGLGPLFLEGVPVETQPEKLK